MQLQRTIILDFFIFFKSIQNPCRQKMCFSVKTPTPGPLRQRDVWTASPQRGLFQVFTLHNNIDHCTLHK